MREFYCFKCNKWVKEENLGEEKQGENILMYCKDCGLSELATQGEIIDTPSLMTKFLSQNFK